MPTGVSLNNLLVSREFQQGHIPRYRYRKSAMIATIPLHKIINYVTILYEIMRYNQNSFFLQKRINFIVDNKLIDWLMIAAVYNFERETFLQAELYLTTRTVVSDQQFLALPYCYCTLQCCAWFQSIILSSHVYLIISANQDTVWGFIGVVSWETERAADW